MSSSTPVAQKIISSALESQLVSEAVDKRCWCRMCEQSYSHLPPPKYDERTHSADGLYKCNSCAKTFHNPGNLLTHARTHTGERPFSCTVCNKTFTQNSTLKAHKRVHTGEKPFRCEICEKTFSQPTSLKCHRRIHTGEKPYICDICQKAFTQLSSLKSHKRWHTGERPYKCKLCEKAFAAQSSLLCHQRIHSGEKPFKCDICLRCFSQGSSLKSHKKIHQREKGYQCDSCGETYFRVDYFSSHCGRCKTMCAQRGELSVQRVSPDDPNNKSFVSLIPDCVIYPTQGVESFSRKDLHDDPVQRSQDENKQDCCTLRVSEMVACENAKFEDHDVKKRANKGYNTTFCTVGGVGGDNEAEHAKIYTCSPGKFLNVKCEPRSPSYETQTVAEQFPSNHIFREARKIDLFLSEDLECENAVCHSERHDEHESKAEAMKASLLNETSDVDILNTDSVNEETAEFFMNSPKSGYQRTLTMSLFSNVEGKDAASSFEWLDERKQNHVDLCLPDISRKLEQMQGSDKSETFYMVSSNRISQQIHNAELPLHKELKSEDGDDWKERDNVGTSDIEHCLCNPFRQHLNIEADTTGVQYICFKCDVMPALCLPC